MSDQSYSFIEIDISPEGDRSKMLAFTEDRKVLVSEDGGESYRDTRVPDMAHIYDCEQRLQKRGKRLRFLTVLSWAFLALVFIGVGVALLVALPFVTF